MLKFLSLSTVLKGPSNFLGGTCVIGVLFFLMGFYYPLDDFYRHLVAYTYGYQPILNYPESQVTNYSQYPLFEFLVGKAHHLWGTSAVVSFLESMSFLLSYLLFYAVSFSYLSSYADTRDAKLIASQISLLFLSVVAFRMVSIRPEYFVFLGFLTFFTRRSIINNVAWILVPFLICSYWLLPLWLGILMFHPDTLKRRLLSVSVIFIIHAMLWQVLSDGDWLFSVLRWQNFSNYRLVSIGELKNFWASAVFSVWFWPIVYLGLLGKAAVNSRKSHLITYGVYSLLGYIRLAGAFLIGAIEPILRGAYLSKVFTRMPWVSYGACVAILISSLPHKPLALFEVPKESTVLAEGISAYSLNVKNPGTIRIVPSFETGASPKEIQQLILDLPEMKVSCALLHKYKINFVVEQSSKTKAPSCLSLTSTYGPWRLWTVQNTPI